jgi:hypothetical protein
MSALGVMDPFGRVMVMKGKRDQRPAGISDHHSKGVILMGRLRSLKNKNSFADR